MAYVRNPDKVEAISTNSDIFLTERYCLYSKRDDELHGARIHHAPWSLQRAELVSLRSTMIESLGLPAPTGDPLLHYSQEISVDIWPLKKVQ